MKTSVHLVKLFVGLPTWVSSLVGGRKNGNQQSKPRWPAHTRCCDPTELLPVISQIRARLAHGSAVPASSGFLNVCPLVQERPMRVTSRQSRWQREFRM